MSNRPVVTNHRPLFILYLIYGFRIGGAERHLLDLCKGLDRRKFRLEIIYFHRDEQILSEYRQAGIPCTIFPVKGGELTFREIWRLSRVIENSRRTLFMFTSSMQAASEPWQHSWQVQKELSGPNTTLKIRDASQERGTGCGGCFCHSYLPEPWPYHEP